MDNFGNHVSFIWSIAEILRGNYKQSEYGKVVLPFTVLRRLDCVLEPSKQAVLKQAASLPESADAAMSEVMLNQIADQTQSITGLVVHGERNGSDGFFVQNYIASYRYRFNAYRHWLFFEIEPFIEWPKEENYHATPGIAFRIEGVFSRN